ncbi:hypothetical protein BJ165DRAFT_861523 [Panaeolus papilionaceus]|nr:hypothetical protein BJ165DRAFT_861523 [Panaeolus papilionaceus]
MLNFFSIFVLGLGSLWLVSAQEDICLQRPEYRWTYNSLNQSPCIVTGILLSVCLNDNVTIRTLSGIDDNYPGAQASGEGAACRCSTVYYSMLSACAYCQAHDWITWIEQRKNCIDTSDRHIPILIPTNTSVPNYAYADVIANSRFDIAAAQAMLSSPSSSLSSSSTSTSSSASTPTPSNPPNTNQGERKSSNTGAIVGGVIGGLIILGLSVTLIVWLVVRSRRKTVAPNGGGLLAPNSPNPSVPHSSPHMSAMGYGSMPSPPLPATSTGTSMLYNPNDPSTYPSLHGSNAGTPAMGPTVGPGPSQAIPPTNPTTWVHNHRATGYDGAA